MWQKCTWNFKETLTRLSVEKQQWLGVCQRKRAPRGAFLKRGKGKQWMPTFGADSKMLSASQTRMSCKRTSPNWELSIHQWGQKHPGGLCWSQHQLEHFGAGIYFLHGHTGDAWAGLSDQKHQGRHIRLVWQLWEWVFLNNYLDGCIPSCGLSTWARKESVSWERSQRVPFSQGFSASAILRCEDFNPQKRLGYSGHWSPHVLKWLGLGNTELWWTFERKNGQVKERTWSRGWSRGNWGPEDIGTNTSSQDFIRRQDEFTVALAPRRWTTVLKTWMTRFRDSSSWRKIDLHGW